VLNPIDLSANQCWFVGIQEIGLLTTDQFVKKITSTAAVACCGGS